MWIPTLSGRTFRGFWGEGENDTLPRGEGERERSFKEFGPSLEI